MDYMPFNSVGGDRVYKAEDWAWYFGSFVSNGVMPVPESGLMVRAGSGMTVTVDAGYAFINGYAYRNQGVYNLSLDIADGVLSRIDRIVVRWDLAGRQMLLAVKKGTSSQNPVAPVLVRDAETWEIALADVSVAAGATSITQSAIRDQRGNGDLCGICAGVLDQMDFSEAMAQYDAAFAEWFKNVQNQLSGDVAGNLQTQIDNLSTDTGKKIDALGKKTTASIKEVDAKTSVRLATKSLTAAGGTVSWTDASITDTSLIEVYATIPNISPTDYTVSGTTLSVTFDEQEKAFDVCATVRK